MTRAFVESIYNRAREKREFDSKNPSFSLINKRMKENGRGLVKGAG